MEPNPVDLKGRLAHTRNRLIALVSERASLALDAASGDAQAVKRITEIDQERSSLGSQAETLEQALGTLKQRANDPLERHRRGFEHDLERRGRNLKLRVENELRVIVDHVDRLLRSREYQEAAQFWNREFNNPNYSVALWDLSDPKELITKLKREAALDSVYISDADLPDNEMFAARRKPARALRDELIAKLCASVDIEPTPQLIKTHKSLTDAIESAHKDSASRERRVVPLGRRDK